MAIGAVELPECPGCAGRAQLLHEGRPGADSDAPPEAYRIARMSYSTPLPVYRCVDCGLAWVKSPYEWSRILHAYGDGEDQAYAREEAARRRTFRRGLEWVQQAVPGGRLLDVGAATGFLLVEARDLGYDAIGIEPSRWAAEEARRRFGVEVRVGSLEQAGFAAASFDVVTMVDVLEHLVDPFAATREVARILRPGGVFYVVTPDIGGLPARLLGRRWWGFEPWHLWFFGQRSLANALRGNGFADLTMRSYRRVFSLDYWLEKGEGMAPPVARLLRRMARGTGLGRRDLALDLRDAVEVVALRVPA